MARSAHAGTPVRRAAERQRLHRRRQLPEPRDVIRRMSQPLTILSDDEAMFRDAVAGFAEAEVRPLVQQMERDGKIDAALVKKFFDMGLMGIEVAEEYGGAGGSCVMIALGV